jgi:hypothetical protein
MTRSHVSLMILACATVAQAQPTTHLASNAVVPTAKSAADAAYLASMGQMRSDLRNLITAQELYQTGNQKFANDIEQLPTFHPMMGAHIDIVAAQANGWAAVETLPVGAGVGRSCVIWVGSIDKTDRPSTESERKTFPEAEVACDGDGLSQRAEWAAAAQSYMTFALKKLAKSEEKYLALNGRYTMDQSKLEPFSWDPGVSVAIVAATEQGWAAKASFALFPGKSCVMWRGELDASGLGRIVDRDQVACDEL